VEERVKDMKELGSFVWTWWFSGREQKEASKKSIKTAPLSRWCVGISAVGCGGVGRKIL
jgi:hypothetical protein